MTIITDYFIVGGYLQLELEGPKKKYWISIPIINFRDVALSVLEEEKCDED